MFFKRFFLLGILFLISFFSSYSVTNDADVYYSFDLDDTSGSTLLDLSTNKYNGTCVMDSNCDTIPGLLINASDFDGTNDYVDVSNISDIGAGSDKTVSFWFKGGSASNDYVFDTTNRFIIFVDHPSCTANYWGYFDGSSIHCFGLRSLTSWEFVVLRITGTTAQLFVNNTQLGVNKTVATIGITGNKMLMSNHLHADSFVNGDLDEFAIYSRALTSDEMTELYNSGTGFNPYSVDTTPQIQTNLSGTYNIENLTGSATTTTNVNMTFYQEGVQFYQVNETNSTTYNLTLVEGVNNISLKSEDANGINWNNFSLTYQPYMYLNFYDNVRAVDVKTVSLFMGNLTYGNNTYEFIEEGYLSQNVTFEVNNISSQVNQTFNVTPITITIKAFDISDLSQITFNMTLSNGTVNQSYSNQVNFSQYYNETVTGNVTAVISSLGYDDATYFLTINPYTSITLNAYLIASNASSVHQFTVQETDSGLALADVTIEVQQLINGSYSTISSKLTGSNGKTYFYLNPSEEYKVIFSKSGYVTATANTIPTVLEYIVKLSSTTDAFAYVEDISYYFKPLSDILQSNNTYSLQAFISGNSFTQTRFIITDSDSNVLYDSTSINPSGTTFSYDYFINYTTNITSLDFNLTYILDGETFSIYKDYTIISFSNESFFLNMVSFGEDDAEDSVLIKWFIIMLATVGIVIFGTTIGNSGVSLLLIPLFAGLSFISWLDWTTAALMIFISLVFFIGGRK